LATLGITLSFVAGLSYAEKFSGRLMDADCYNTNKVASQEAGHKTYKDITKTCAATASTANFAVRIKGSGHGADLGNTIKLDDSGNTIAAQEMKNGTLRPDADGDVHVRVSGKLMGETFKTATVTPGHGGKGVASSK
jgi:hypothetical protein